MRCTIRTPNGEMDSIAGQGEITIFVDVNTRTSKSMGLPEESNTPRNCEHLIACVEYHAVENEIDQWRLEVLSMEGKLGSEPLVAYFENAIT